MFFDLAYIDRIISPEILDQHKPMTFPQAVEYFDLLGLRYELEERAAILEYDGGLGRDEAERQAVKEIFERNT